MSVKWEKYAIGEIGEVFDGPHATPKKAESGPIFLGISNLVGGRIDLSSTEYLSEQDYKIWTRRVTPKEHDIVFSYETRLGEVAIIPKSFKCCLGRRMGLIRLNQKIVDPKFLLYYYLSPSFQDVIKEKTVYGSTVERISIKEFPSFPVFLPPLSDQRRIAAILTALDDKIELNRRMNETLEGIARAVWEEWFGKEDTSDLIELGEVVDFNPRVSIAQGEEVVYVEMRDVPENGMNVSGFVQKPFSSGSKFQANDTLLARITPCLENGKTAFVNFLQPGEKAFGSTEFIVMRAKEGVSPYFVYFVARDERFRQFAIGSMVGSSGRQRVQSEILPSFEVAIYDIKKMAKFHAFAKLIFEEIFLNFQQSQTLTALRDALLPRLMRGEVIV